MHFPTVICNLSKHRHAFKDQKHYECGIKSNISSTPRIILKNINIKPIEDITCLKCKSILKK
jgi:hypothetical protein